MQRISKIYQIAAINIRLLKKFLLKISRQIKSVLVTTNVVGLQTALAYWGHVSKNSSANGLQTDADFVTETGFSLICPSDLKGLAQIVQ